MITRKQSITIIILSCLFTEIACGGGGTVERFAPCATTDTCPSATVCEVATPSSGSSAAPGPTFCTWSCTDDDFNTQLCPTDVNGVQGVCVIGIGNTLIGSEDQFGFCFQDCSTSAPCPNGESCAPAAPFRGGSSAMVCVPTPSDPISQTSWTSTTIAPSAQAKDVKTSSYTMMFAATSGAVSGLASGAFTATLVQTYAASAFQYANCTETITYTGGTWVDLPPTSDSEGVFTINNTQSTTGRTGCTSSDDDTTNDTTVAYDVDTTDDGASYNASATNMKLSGLNGGVPYTDDVTWAFTKN